MRGLSSLGIRYFYHKIILAVDLGVDLRHGRRIGLGLQPRVEHANEVDGRFARVEEGDESAAPGR